MPVQKTKAIVIGHHPLGESDKIIVFHTQEFGNIRAVARGARKIKNRLSGRLEILTCGELVFYERPGKDLHTVNSFEIIESFQPLREDLMKIAYCSYIAELIQRVEFSDGPDSNIFGLMLDIMFMMKTTDDPEMLVRVFEMRLLTSTGFSPQLDVCLECSHSIDGTGSPGFSIAEGGIICSKCRAKDERSSVLPISRGTLELMKRMQQAPLELIPRLRIMENNRRELKKTLRSFISFHINVGRMRSLDFLASIEDDVMLKA